MTTTESCGEHPHDLDRPHLQSLRAACCSSAELTVVVPTFNERDNLLELFERIDVALRGRRWEIVVVDDDSPDGTWRLAKRIASTDLRMRCVRRIGRRGLAGACIEGILTSAAPFVAVMDGDLQHDESLLPRMLDHLATGDVDLVIASRYSENRPSYGLTQRRASLSRWATTLSSLVLKIPTTDPMSGFFMVRRPCFEEAARSLTSSGFKLLADLLLSSPQLRTMEIGYRFRRRTAGHSKLDFGVSLDFLGLLLNQATHRLIPLRFIFFLLTGSTGVAVHLVVLHIILTSTPAVGFASATAMAATVAMTSNFFVNNFTTYRDSRLRGLCLLTGLGRFYLACSIGALSNIGVASWIYGGQHVWWLAGLVGAFTGAVWNYTLSSLLVWRK
jgi:dolichol-phosphate mannosyltransferase